MAAPDPCPPRGGQSPLVSICFLIRLGLPDDLAPNNVLVMSAMPVVVGLMPDTCVLESDHCIAGIEGRHARLAATAEGLHVTALAGATYVNGTLLETSSHVVVPPPVVISFGGECTMDLAGVKVPNPFVYMFARHDTITPLITHTIHYMEEFSAFDMRVRSMTLEALAAEARRAAKPVDIQPMIELPVAGDLPKFLREASTCIICTDESVQPHQLACGHIGCGACLMRWWRMKGECPVCRAAVPRPVLNRVLDGALRALECAR